MSTQGHSGEVVIVPIDDMRSVIFSALCARGATPADAELQADTLIEGELRGQPSHGIRRLPVLARRLENGVTTSGLAPVLTWPQPARVHIDGRGSFGPVIAHRAIDVILPTARDYGIGVALITNAGHVGMLAPYVERIANEGFVGVMLTVSEALVAPPGGKRAMVGTNPVGIGIPTAKDPLVLDMSTAAVSAGKILDYAARGEPIPLGWAVDRDGNATTDASAAAEGAIAPFGGVKGYALGIAIEVLVGVLAGSAFGEDVYGTLDTTLAPTKGDLILALPLGDVSTPLKAAAAYLEDVRKSGADGTRVLVPGDRSRETRRQRLQDGVPLDPTLWAEVRGLA